MKRAIVFFAAVLLATCTFTGCNKPAENQNDEITIGRQVWAARNLNVDKFRNGDLITEAKTDEEWKRAGDNKQPAWCWYDNKQENGERFGRLYNWYAVSDHRGLAPEGWRVPSDDDWKQLTDFLGGSAVAGARLKSPDFKPGSEDKVGGHNFNALPGGGRYHFGYFYGSGSLGYWWTATEYGDYSFGWYRFLYFNSNVVFRYLDVKGYGFSVRCIREYEVKKTAAAGKPESDVLLIVDEPPSFPGGDTALDSWMDKNLKIPAEAKRSRIHGRSIVSLIVESDGSLSNVVVKRTIGGGCDEEAVRLVQAMPKWTPGKQNGKIVRVQINLPVEFPLE